MVILSGEEGIAVWVFKIIVFAFMSFNVYANACSLSAISSSTSTENLYIFVSFSMPEQSLKQWAKEAALVNGKLVLRGFLENSVLKTTNQIHKLFGEELSVDLDIDPEKFRNFNITAVPAVVITEIKEPFAKAFSENNERTPEFDVVYGDTTLEAALKRIVDTGSGNRQKTAKQLLNCYRGVCEKRLD